MRLKELREEKNLSQKQVSVAINTNQSNIARWENGLNEPAISFAIALADFFGVTVDYLIGRTDELGNVAAMPPSAPQIPIFRDGRKRARRAARPFSTSLSGGQF